MWKIPVFYFLIAFSTPGWCDVQSIIGVIKKTDLYIIRAESNSFDESQEKSSDLILGATYKLDKVKLGWEYDYSYRLDNFVISYGPTFKYALLTDKGVAAHFAAGFGLSKRKAYSYYTEGLYKSIGIELSIPLIFENCDLLFALRTRDLNLGSDDLTQSTVGIGLMGQFH